MNHNPYKTLLVMVVIHFLAMYVLMYSMVDNLSNVFPNLNQFYMAVIMTAPMIILELSLMSSMYHNKKQNTLIIAFSIFVFIVFFLFIRQQTMISDQDFLKSMIPHHAGAILMCEKASLQDPEIKELCKSILSSQQSEIDQMKSKLDEMSR